MAPPLQGTVLQTCGLKLVRPGQSPLAWPDLTLQAGQSLHISGPSGVGKTTLLSILAGVIPPSHGDARVLGQSLQQLSLRQRDVLRGERMGVVFQQFNLLPHLSVADNILLPARLFAARRQGRSPAELLSEVDQLLLALRLPAEIRSRPARQLSVGQQQRVAVARALLGQPPLILADEPTSALDEEARRDFLELMLSLQREVGCALVMVSHDLRQADLFDQHLRLMPVAQ